MLIAFILIVIALHDFITKRIPNPYLLILFACLIFQEQRIHSVTYLFINVPLILLFTKISGCGFGDSKLALIIVNFLIPTSAILRYLELMTLISAFLVLLHLIRYRSPRGNIAFGPALCGAVLPFLT